MMQFYIIIMMLLPYAASVLSKPPTAVSPFSTWSNFTRTPKITTAPRDSVLPGDWPPSYVCHLFSDSVCFFLHKTDGTEIYVPSVQYTLAKSKK